MNSPYKILPHYTYKEWALWEGKWELIDGIPHAMSPSPVPRHQRLASELNTELNLALRNSKCGKACKVYEPIDYKISEDTILIPDILIVCNEIKKPYLDFAPALVVEILSPSTALKDRNTKYQLYEQEQVKYYLIADPDKETIEVYTLTDNKYVLQPFTASFVFELEKGCSITVPFNHIFS
ncbi:MAG: Uma2 family endonuclease [Niabella sp.]